MVVKMSLPHQGKGKFCNDVSANEYQYSYLPGFAEVLLYSFFILEERTSGRGGSVKQMKQFAFLQEHVTGASLISFAGGAGEAGRVEMPVFLRATRNESKTTVRCGVRRGPQAESYSALWPLYRF